MKEIYSRDFELVIEHGVNVIWCYLSDDNNNIKELDEYIKTIPSVNLRSYCVCTNIDMWETYEMNTFPYILVFSENKLINKFIYTTLDDFKNKVDLNSLVKGKK